jgi:hypothetical protein
MSNGTPAPERKGLHPLAWVGIGCGVILVIVVAAMLIGGFFLARTVKNVAEDFEDNPGLAAARFVVKASPELEEVETDEEAGTMTIRNTKTGELITVNFEDIKEGRFSWTADGEEVSVDVSEAESGTVKIESSDGDGFQLTTGDAVTGDVPEWVPVYPGTEPKNRGSMKTDDTESGNYTTQTEDSADEVLEYFRETLKAEGYKVNINTFTSDDSGGGMVNGSLESEGKTLVVLVNTDGGSTSITVTHSIKK